MRLNGRMSKTQPSVILAMIIGGLIIFQNCSKVGVEDLSVDATNKVSGMAVQDEPGSPTDIDDRVPTSMPPTSNPDNGAGDYADPTMDPIKVPPPMPMIPNPGDGDDDSMPIVVVPPTQGTPDGDQNPISLPPVDLPSDNEDAEEPKKCVKLSELGLSVRDPKMQTVKCLLNPKHQCVVICHQPGNKKKAPRTKIVRSERALKAHLSHGDTLGFCRLQQSQDQEVCETREDKIKSKKRYGKKHKDNHYDDRGKSCGKSEDHEHDNNPGDERDEDDHDHDHDHDENEHDHKNYQHGSSDRSHERSSRRNK
jgi:hypothetical protein